MTRRAPARRHAAAATSRTSGRPAALVVGLDCVTGLQTSRLLARRGIPVVGVVADPSHPCARTNTATRVVTAPADGPGLEAVIRRLAADHPGAVLYPCTDASVRTLSRPGALPDGLRSSLPEAEVVDTLMAKDAFERHCASLGVPVPRSRTVTDRSQLAGAVRELRPPFVVKPALKTAAWEAAGPKVRWYETSGGLADAGAELLTLTDALVVQEWIPGADDRLYSCNVYVSPDGSPVVTFVARKLRQWPPRLGTSSLGEAVWDPAIAELALRVLTSLPFTGLGYVEIKRDANSGTDVVIEANVGRPTGRSAIAEGGGVELLATMYADLVGAPLPASRTQRPDVEVKWLQVTADVQSAWHELRRGELTVPAWWRSWRGDKVLADLDLRDPAPFVGLVTRRLGRPRWLGTGARRRPTSTTDPVAVQDA